jgi:hypothetical protein
MRLDRAGIGVDEALEQVLGVDLAHPLLEIVVAALERGADRGHLLAGELEPQHVVLDPLAPQLVEFGRTGRPRGVLAVEGIALVDGEIELGREQFARLRAALAHALHVDVEDVERRLQPTIAQRIVETGAVAGETVDVALQEERAVGVERFDVAVEDLGRERVVERRGLVVEAAVAEQLRDPGRGFGLLVGRRERDIGAGRRHGGGAGHAERGGQQDGKQGVLEHGGPRGKESRPE